MHITISYKRRGAMAGLALVLSSVLLIGSTPASGHAAAAARSSTTAKDEQRETATFNADIARLNHDFAALPPEINSARMDAGPGAGPMLAAAQAWDALADELNATASSLASTTAGLAGLHWQGTGSADMAAAEGPDVTWLRTAAEQAEQAAAQAKAAAASFDASR